MTKPTSTKGVTAMMKTEKILGELDDIIIEEPDLKKRLHFWIEVKKEIESRIRGLKKAIDNQVR